MKEFSLRFILGFLFSWMAASLIDITLFNTYQINLGFLLVMVLNVYVLRMMLIEHTWITHLATTVLIGCMYALLKHIILVEPILVEAHDLIYIILILSFVTALFTRSAIAQIFIITLGIFAGDMAITWFRENRMLYVWGSAMLNDYWWAVLFSTRVISGVMEWGSQRWRMIKKFIMKE